LLAGDRKDRVGVYFCPRVNFLFGFGKNIEYKFKNN
jgi:hypothetical protein